MIRTLTTFLLVITSLALQAGTPLQMNKEGKFKIVQFTDTHYIYQDARADTATATIKDILRIEKPDLVIFTGDMVFGSPVKLGLHKLMAPVIESGTPWIAVLGNHDGQFDLSRDQVYTYLQQLPGNLMPARPAMESPDYAIEVKKHGQPERTSYLLYCLDTHDGPPIKGLGSYAWITTEQINWIKDANKAYTKLNGGKKIPSIVFSHIPPLEFDYAYNENREQVVGVKREPVCAPVINSGMFAALCEMGSVRGWFCGHDHDSDYSVPYYGILLGYGRYSGGNTVYNHLGQTGARVIILSEDKPLETYIRLRDGSKPYKEVHN